MVYFHFLKNATRKISKSAISEQCRHKEMNIQVDKQTSTKQCLHLVAVTLLNTSNFFHCSLIRV